MTGLIELSRNAVCEAHHTANRCVARGLSELPPSQPYHLASGWPPGWHRRGAEREVLARWRAAPMGDAINDTLERSLSEAFARETRVGLQLSVSARLAAFSLLWLSFYLDALGNPANPYFLYRTALIAAAWLGGVAAFLIARRSRRPVQWSYPFLLADLTLATALVFGWLPRSIVDYPQFLAVRYQDILLFAVIVASTVFALSPRLVLLAGACAAAAWMTGVLTSFLRTSGAMTSGAAETHASHWTDLLVTISHPLVLDTDYFVLQIFLLAAFAALLSLSVSAGRKLVDSTVRAARDRAALARFFPPQLADRLAASDERLRSITSAAAVLFVDFPRDARAHETLEEFYAICECVVFEHGGVIDRFVGDPVMATFGAFATLDAANRNDVCDEAWRCARALEQALGERAAGIGLHFGEVVSGEMGSERQRAFAVVGHTINVARRTLDVAIQRHIRIAVTDVFVRRLPPELRERLTFLGEVILRGIGPPMRTWAA